MSDLYNKIYNPDILSCLANLSNDEVFTPPEVANAMLDLLPQELFSDPNTTFLDPACKSGVFLREIAKRLLVGLEPIIPDLQERTDHIFRKQLFGIAITELTAHLSRRSLYCSKTANGNYSVTRFDTVDGNLRFKRTQHRWQDGRCVFCGASQAEYGPEKRGDDLETHAYEWIHTTKPEEIFKMKFDVIVSNPPYQLETGGSGKQAKPIYNLFVEQAKKLNPRYLTMIIQSRWFAGGMGLDGFRQSMTADHRIRSMVDFANAKDCFPQNSISGGVCYFLWDRDNKGDCKVFTHRSQSIGTPMSRPLLEEGCDTFIRYNEAIGIIHKIFPFHEKTMDELVSSRQPFGLSTTFHGRSKKAKNDIMIYENQGVSYTSLNNITKNSEDVFEWKVIIPRSGSGSDAFPHPILGRPFVGAPGSACSETYIYIGPFDTEEICKNVISYISTKFLRFLAMLKKVTQSTTRAVYTLVPVQDFSRPWTDEELYAKYGLTEEEIAFIDSMIKPMDLDGDE